jgi:hypothetical protein
MNAVASRLFNEVILKILLVCVDGLRTWLYYYIDRKRPEPRCASSGKREIYRLAEAGDLLNSDDENLLHELGSPKMADLNEAHKALAYDSKCICRSGSRIMQIATLLSDPIRKAYTERV